MDLCQSDQPAVAAAQHIKSLIEQWEHKPILCLCAGGSAFKIISGLHLTEEQTARTIFMLGDERLSSEVQINNYLQLKTLLDEQTLPYRTIDTSAAANATVVTYAQTLTDKLQNVLDSHADLKIISILGIGVDGHTAGIFPMDEKTFSQTYKSDQIYVPLHLTHLTIDSRASLTPQWLLQKVDAIIGYAAGSNKAEILHTLLTTDKPVHMMPAQLLKQHQHSTLYTDLMITAQHRVDT